MAMSAEYRSKFEANLPVIVTSPMSEKFSCGTGNHKQTYIKYSRFEWIEHFFAIKIIHGTLSFFSTTVELKLECIHVLLVLIYNLYYLKI